MRGSAAVLAAVLWASVNGCAHFDRSLDGPRRIADLPNAPSVSATETATDSPEVASGTPPVSSSDSSNAIPSILPPLGPAETGPPPVWGTVGLRTYPIGEKIAPNGLEFRPVFSTDLHLNLWLWSDQRVYLFTDTNFWAQKANSGITNAAQGQFDFSKREFDLDAGLAWNYAGNWEARTFAYSFNNLNRGTSPSAPHGFNDGVGLENRYYLGPSYDDLGKPTFDVARATFVSLGYFPSKNIVDGNGIDFQPGPFARAYLTLDLGSERCYAYIDSTAIGNRSFNPKLIDLDTGVAFRPFARSWRWEFRAGMLGNFDLQSSEKQAIPYGAVRLIF